MGALKRAGWRTLPRWYPLFVELKDGAQARSDEIIAFCRSHMAHFEVTEGSSARAAAKASMGKIQKFMLRPQAGDAVKR